MSQVRNNRRCNDDCYGLNSIHYYYYHAKSFSTTRRRFLPLPTTKHPTPVVNMADPVHLHSPPSAQRSHFLPSPNGGSAVPDYNKSAAVVAGRMVAPDYFYRSLSGLAVLRKLRRPITFRHPTNISQLLPSTEFIFRMVQRCRPRRLR